MKLREKIWEKLHDEEERTCHPDKNPVKDERCKSALPVLNLVMNTFSFQWH